VARAETLELIVQETGQMAIPIMDNGMLDNDPLIGSIQVKTDILNLSLFNYQFVGNGLGAFSSSPDKLPAGTLQQGGTAQLLASGTGSITILATDINYSVPTVPPGTLLSSATGLFNNAASGTNTFQSWFNGDNTLEHKTPPGPKFTLTSTNSVSDSQKGDASTGITLVNPYGLTNEKVITLTGALATDQYQGSTTITGGTAVPEPASMALMLAALPVWIFGVMRRRKARAA